jgi:MFS family permease
VVSGAFVLLALAFGATYSFPAFFAPLRDEFDATRGEVSIVFSLTAFLTFAVGAFSGMLADRVGTRPILLAGAAVMASGLFLASFANELWQVYLTYSVFVGVGGGFLYVPAISTVQRWFVRRRGLASGIAATGIGAGTLLLPLLALGLIEISDWRVAYVGLGVVALVAGVGASLLIVDAPSRIGLRPDGDASGGDANSQRLAGVAVATAITSRPFRLLYLSSVLGSTAVYVPFAHIAPYAEDHGLGEGAGAVLVGVIGIGSTLGRFTLGEIADRIGRRRSYAASYAGMVLILTWWLVATEFWSLAIFALFFGVFYGGVVALIPPLITDYFGPRKASTILGITFTAAAFGALAGPLLAGLFHDVGDSYSLPIAFAVVISGLAVGGVLMTPDPQRWREELP